MQLPASGLKVQRNTARATGRLSFHRSLKNHPTVLHSTARQHSSEWWIWSTNGQIVDIRPSVSHIGLPPTKTHLQREVRFLELINRKSYLLVLKFNLFFTGGNRPRDRKQLVQIHTASVRGSSRTNRNRESSESGHNLCSSWTLEISPLGTVIIVFIVFDGPI